MRVTVTLLSLAAALFLTLLLFGLPLVESSRLLFEGAFGDRAGVSRTFVKATPLILTGLGMVVAWRAGMYNIGGEGQFIVGALAGAAIAKLVGASTAGPMLNLMILGSALVGGGVWAAIAGWLQVARGVQAVISTILLNFVAIQLLAWAVAGPLRRPDGGLPQTAPLPESAMLLRFDRQLDLNTGLIYSLFATLAIWVFLYGTTWGFRLRLVGAGPSAARASRIPAGSVSIASMAISGALCGLAGAIEYTGITGTLGAGFPQGWGFFAIPVALLGALHPFGTLLSATYFGALIAGSENLGRFSAGGSTLVYVIQAAAVLALVLGRSVHFRKSASPAEERA